MKIKLNNNTELNVLAVNGTQRHFQGYQRDSLEFVFEKDAYPFDALESHFGDKNKTAAITIIDDGNPNEIKEYLHEGYILRVSMNLAPIVTETATATTPEITNERITVTMAQETYMEHMVAQLLESKTKTQPK